MEITELRGCSFVRHCKGRDLQGCRRRRARRDILACSCSPAPGLTTRSCQSSHHMPKFCGFRLFRFKQCSCSEFVLMLLSSVTFSPHERKRFVCLKHHFAKLNLGRPQRTFAHRYYSFACWAGAFTRIFVNKMGPQSGCLKSVTPFRRTH